jgi:hypothetical protein
MRDDTRRGWRQWGIEEARAALGEQARSGKSDAAFARDAGCSTQRIRYWRQRLAEIDRVRFAEVPVPVPPTPPPSIATVEITIGPIVVCIRELDESAVARLVLALAGKGSC